MGLLRAPHPLMRNPLPLLLPFLALSTASTTADHTVDVAIVGGGFSGLAAAKDIAAAGKSFVVLEARDRVGGRVWNVDLPDGGYVEVGATFVGPTQDRVLALAESLGIGLTPTYDTGDSLLWLNGVGSRYAGTTSFPVPDEVLGEILNGMTLLETIAGQLDTSQPWAHPNATDLDSGTFHTWLEANVPSPDARFFFDVFSTSVFSTQPREVSLLYVASYIAAAGNASSPGSVLRLISTSGGAQESRIAGGTQRLATTLATRLGAANIALNQPVSAISKCANEGTYTVTAANITVSARAVIVAMAPPLAARIAYTPALPAARDALTQRLPMGSIGKAIAIYATPFWRAANFTGQVLSDVGVARSTFDISPPDASFGALMGFIEADEMRRYDAVEESVIEAAVVEDYVRYFGEGARDVRSWVVQRWDNEIYSRGGPVAFGPPGTLSQYGEWVRKGDGGVHFAGTEGSEYWTGYMDGAVRSGERAAKEVLGAL